MRIMSDFIARSFAPNTTLLKININIFFIFFKSNFPFITNHPSTVCQIFDHLRPVVVVPQSRKHGQAGEVLSDGLRHVSQHVNHHLCGELAWRDVRWTVAAAEKKKMF